MSRSQFGQGQKPLDMFFWVNEISGEITYPLQKADAPAVSPESPQEKPPSQPRSAQGAPGSPQGPPAQRPAPAPPPKASPKDSGARNPHSSAPTWARPMPEEGGAPTILSNPCHHLITRRDSAHTRAPGTSPSATGLHLSCQPFCPLGLQLQAEKCPY
nr:LOW QUALITY PROTEIN: uncharacterized protein C3orf86 homolog [Saimiri boliviensis boliviensis]